MKKTIVILAALIFCVSSLAYAETQKYQTAPLPHYTKEIGYGWYTKTPISKPDHVWHILKTWKHGLKVSVFADKNKNGKCDTVYEFMENGKFNADGEELVIRRPDSRCEQKEKEIKAFLDKKKGE